jgi:hypothetical protein
MDCSMVHRICKTHQGEACSIWISFFMLLVFLIWIVLLLLYRATGDTNIFIASYLCVHVYCIFFVASDMISSRKKSSQFPICQLLGLRKILRWVTFFSLLIWRTASLILILMLWIGGCWVQWWNTIFDLSIHVDVVMRMKTWCCDKNEEMVHRHPLEWSWFFKNLLDDCNLSYLYN